MLPTPLTPHLANPEFESVYEPAEDTFILLDALEQDADVLRGSRVCLEVGSGSGCVITFLASICGTHSALYLTTDLNSIACRSTLLTARTNSQPLIESINTDLTSSLSPRLHKAVDVLVFNPPYVETEEEEAITAQQDAEKKGIEKTWAGGAQGMRVTNRLLEQVKDLLSPRGLFYLVAVPENKPQQILANMRSLGLHGEIVLKRRAGREHLHVLRFSHPEHYSAAAAAAP
ncbi:hypothetical protein JCM10908_006168 [Rhodotorula pacifica]|uniref:S-adenosylmethionine-dependent methyltransferase n=1 Tax=Rhodotorula pacifica TaxID=1495444 RepID=UPI00316BC3FB